MNKQSMTALAAALALGACATGGGYNANDTNPPPATRGSVSQAGIARWTASVQPQAGSSISGTLTVSQGNSANRTRANVSLTGATPGASLPWHIHQGTCDAPGPIVGPREAYTMLGVSGDGTATIQAELPFAVPASGAYSINVHRSATEMGTIVACGNLTQTGP
jgi:hypothetical protein